MNVKLYTPPVPLVPGAPETLPGTFFRLTDDLLESADWTFGPPADLSPSALAADVECAAEMTCEECCWAAGLAYAGFHQGDDYRAFGVCPTCGHCTEL